MHTPQGSYPLLDKILCSCCNLWYTTRNRSPTFSDSDVYSRSYTDYQWDQENGTFWDLYNPSIFKLNLWLAEISVMWQLNSRFDRLSFQSCDSELSFDWLSFQPFKSHVTSWSKPILMNKPTPEIESLETTSAIETSLEHFNDGKIKLEIWNKNPKNLDT